ncbi:hypothetical protein CBS101457_006878 [Exobasidium rhododendri]|nr:hypothetical protein CBS101457_006878 [Exobasidium rhododendri]
MSFSLDTIVNLGKVTVFHPVTLLAWLAYKAKEVNGWPERNGSITTAYVVLGLYFTRWFSNRWRNGIIPQRRLNSETWPKELVLVTGGAQGIGKATCDRLIKKGAKVVAIDIIDIKSSHPNMRAYQCDISSYDALDELREKIMEDVGQEVTMVANIAGMNNKSLILDLNKDRVSKMIDVNLKSHFWTAMVFLPAMVKRKRGHFLSVASTMGYAGITHQSDYVATKHGLVGMQETLYYEMSKMYKTPLVRTSIAMIGHTKTALFQDFDVGVAGRFIAPPLEADYVASLIVDAFEAQETRIILTPVANNLAPGFKMLPSFLKDLLQSSAGADGAYPSRPSAEQLGN